MKKFGLAWSYYFPSIFIFLFGFSAFAFDPLANAEGRIKKYRMREVLLKLEEEGEPKGEILVQVNMLRHQFLFGCNLFRFGSFSSEEENQRYLRLWSEVFNYATVPFYFRARSEKGYLRNYEMVEWCQSRGIAVKGHPLLWHLPEKGQAWLGEDTELVESDLEERVKGLIREFKFGIKYWDLLNEPTMAWRYDTPVARWENKIGPVKAFEKAQRWAKAVDPSAVILINDFNVNEIRALSSLMTKPDQMIKFLKDPVPHYSVSYARLIAELKRRGSAPEAIGIQSHMHRGNWQIWDCYELLERYSRLGIPIHFTEITILSGEPREKIYYDDPERNLPWPSTPSWEQVQRDYLERFYTLLFSHPRVSAISWWDFSDRGAWLNAPAGLVRADLSPKPAYHQLRYLIREKWWTNLKGKTDEKGELRFRGFCGDYQVLIPEAKKKFEFRIDCEKGEGQKIVLRLEKTGGSKRRE